MTFRETIDELVKKTEKYEVMACISYGDAKTDIGIRRSTYHDKMMRDPIIDNEWFMICGDIYIDANTPDAKRLTSTKDLAHCALDRLTVHLYAVNGWMPGYATIELGNYDVLDKQVSNYDSLLGWPDGIKLTVKRRS